MGVIENLGGGFSPFAEGGRNLLNQYSWVFWIFVPIAALIFVAVIWKMYNDKNKQWTHKLIVRRVLQNKQLSKPTTIRMRRFPLIKTGEIFELEKPLLGSYLIPELDSYTGDNEYSIIIDTNNRIYTNKGENFCPDAESVNVSAKHAEIDISLGEFKKNYQQVHKTPERIEWGKIAKFTMLGLLIIAVMVVSIKGIEQWGKNHEADAQKAELEAQAFEQLRLSLEVIDGTVNTQSYILDKIKGIEGTNNIQQIIKNTKSNVTS